MKRLAILLALATLAGHAQADSPRYDGNQLLKACSASERFTEGTFRNGQWEEDSDFYLCHGYVRATMDTIDAMTAAFNLPQRVCIPDAVTQGQIARVYVAFLKAHPKDLQVPGSLLLMNALREAYPCQKN